MQEYVQKSTSTTLPRSASRDSGSEFSHCVAPSSGGMVPLTDRSAGEPRADIVAPPPVIACSPPSSRCCPVTYGTCSRTSSPAGRCPGSGMSRPNNDLLDPRRARRRHTREEAGVEAERDGDRAGHDCAAQRATDARLGAERALHRREHLSPEQQRRGQRDAGTCREREQQQRRFDVRAASAAPVKINPRIGPAHGAQSMPVATPSNSDEPNRRVALRSRAREPVAEGDDGPRQAISRRSAAVARDRK